MFFPYFFYYKLFFLLFSPEIRYYNGNIRLFIVKKTSYCDVFFQICDIVYSEIVLNVKIISIFFWRLPLLWKIMKKTVPDFQTFRY